MAPPKLAPRPLLSAAARYGVIFMFLFIYLGVVTSGAAAAQTRATFIGSDVNTQGNWKQTYGADGYWVAEDSASHPNYAQVSLAKQSSRIWASSTDDSRALLKATTEGRIASAWAANWSFSIDIRIPSGESHQVALYCLDWDQGRRVQTVEVIDAASQGSLDRQSLGNFGGGQYLVWEISGHVRIQVTRVRGGSPVASGLFFGHGAGVQPERDITPPTISAVASSEVTDGGATITWVTDENADAGVDYGTTKAYERSVTATQPPGTNHRVNLSGLAPNTSYYYRVLSRDPAGNLAKSADFTFTTGGPPTPTPTPTPAPSPTPTPGPGDPELPRERLDTTFVPPTGRTIEVKAGDDLQAALDAALPGDTLSLEAGASFPAPPEGFLLRPKPNPSGQWVVVRGSDPGRLAPPSTRVTPADAAAMPKILAPWVGPALATSGAASRWRLIGLEVTLSPSAPFSYGLVYLGSDLEADAGNLPSDLIIDRCYIHGLAGKDVRRGVALNSRRSAVIDSYLSEFHEAGADSQAVAGWNGPGPFKLENNYLEGAGENVLFGGADPAVRDLVPSDIELRRNHLFKPRSWWPGDPNYGGRAWSVKNVLELKSARRVLIEGNVLEHNWVGAQNGFAVLFTVRNQDGRAPWSVVEDVTFANNIVRGAAAAINILGRDYNAPSQQSRRIKIWNNLFEAVGSAPWGGSGRFLQITDTVDVKVENNTILHTGNLVTGYANRDTPSNVGFVYRNNVSPHNAFGVIGDGAGVGNGTLGRYFPGAVFTHNVLAGGPAGLYPGGNFFPATLEGVGFADLAGGDYRLGAGSQFKGAGSDGRDPGADFGALGAATSGIVR